MRMVLWAERAAMALLLLDLALLTAALNPAAILPLGVILALLL